MTNYIEATMPVNIVATQVGPICMEAPNDRKSSHIALPRALVHEVLLLAKQYEGIVLGHSSLRRVALELEPHFPEDL